MKCHVVEDEALTLNMFIQGLRDELSRELFFRGVTTLDHAYSSAREYELLISISYEKCDHHRSPMSLAPPQHESVIEPFRSSVPPIWKNKCKGRDSPRPHSPYRRRIDNHSSVSLAPLPPVKSLLRPPPSNVLQILENRGKFFKIPGTSSHLLCISYKNFGHISSKCPNRALVIEERKDIIEESLKDQIFEPKFEECDDLNDIEDTSLCSIRTFPMNLGVVPLVPDTSQLNVVCHTLCQPKGTDDLCNHVIFKENLENWDLILPTIQIAYNNSVHRFIGTSSIKVIHGYKSRKPLDLIPMSPYTSMSMSVEAFVRHLHDLHIEINK